MLLFVVLFYVYPLKFLFLSAFSQTGASVGGDEMREVVLLYSSGFSTIYFLFAALYMNAYRQRDRLLLSPIEKMLTRYFIVEEMGTALTGVVVCVTAMFLPAGKTASACLLFLWIGAWKSIMGARAGRAARRMRKAEEAATPAAEAQP